MFFFFSERTYVALVGDIVSSKKLADRDSIQKQLNAVLNEVNENSKYHNDIAAQFIITLGDEFQGLLFSGEHLIEIITEIEIKMYPTLIRFGIGVGNIDTEINRIAALGADGEAYHLARQMIEAIRLQGNKSKPIPTDAMIRSAPQNEKIDLLINTIFSLCRAMKSKWTERQKEVVYDCLLNGDNQSQAALRLDKQQPAIHKNLIAAGYYSYKSALETIDSLLLEIQHGKGCG